MRRIIIIILLALAFAPLVNAQNVLSVRSDNLKSMVEKQNERIQAKQFEAQAAKSRTGYFARSFLPTLEVYGAQDTFRKGREEQKTQPAYGAEARLNLFNGGRDKLESSRRNVAAERVKLERSVVLAEEVQKARSAYWTIIYLRDLSSALSETLAANDKNLGAAQRRIRSGVATEADRVEFEMNGVDLKREQQRALQELSSTQRELLVVLGHAPETKIEFGETLTHEHDWEELLKHSESEHFNLTKPAELRSEELTTQASIQNRAWLPRLDAYAAWNQFNELEEEFTDAKDRQEAVVGVRLSLNLGEVVSAKSEGSALRAEAQAAKAEASYVKREVENHIHSEMNELKLLHSFVHEADENIKRASRYYQLTQSEYVRGVKNSPDVLGAAEKLFEARRRRLEILRDFQIAKTHVLSKLGK